MAPVVTHSDLVPIPGRESDTAPVPGTGQAVPICPQCPLDARLGLAPCPNPCVVQSRPRAAPLQVSTGARVSRLLCGPTNFGGWAQAWGCGSIHPLAGQPRGAQEGSGLR